MDGQIVGSTVSSTRLLQQHAQWAVNRNLEGFLCEQFQKWASASAWLMIYPQGVTREQWNLCKDRYSWLANAHKLSIAYLYADCKMPLNWQGDCMLQPCGQVYTCTQDLPCPVIWEKLKLLTFFFFCISFQSEADCAIVGGVKCCINTKFKLITFVIQFPEGMRDKKGREVDNIS